MKTGGPVPGVRSSGATHDAAAAAVCLVRELLDAPAGRRAAGGGAAAVPAGKPGPGTDRSRGAGEPATEPASWTEAAGVLAALNLDEHCIAAGLAGLLVERGAVGLDAVQAHLGAEAAALVEGLLRFDELRSFSAGDSAPAGRDAGAERAKQAERLRRLLLAVVDDVRVLIVQLALTLHRLRTARERPRAERERLARESLEIYAPLASRLGIWQCKWEIEDLAFRESDPATYRRIARQLDERRVDRERYVEDVVRRLGADLARAGVDAEVTGRAKHIHSIWRKMRRKSPGPGQSGIGPAGDGRSGAGQSRIEQSGIEQIFDLRAIRVLVDTVAECYTVLGIVHGRWTHIPREFDDYVTHPKPNGYRSLHTAVVGPGGRTLEVQIRTREMHAQAELGVAAHWRYKEGARGPETEADARIAWLRRILEHREEADEPGSPLVSLGLELDAERVYAFTPRGDVVDLPAGSTPLDFAYQIHTEVGHRCRGAKVDGRIVPLTYTVRSGDRIEVLTARQPRPSRDWLNPNLGYLGSARSRAKVRHWFKHQDRERNVADGQEIWDRELKRLGVGDPPREALAEKFNASRFDDFLAALGRGDVSVPQLAGALQPYLPAPPPPPPKPAKRRRSRTGDVRISGVGDLLTQMAQCCKPLPHDPITGYITRGRGVSIHRADCRNVLDLAARERARLIDVAWSGGAEETWPVEVAVEAYDRKGLLRDATTVVSGEGVNIIAMESQTDPRTHVVGMRITLEVRDVEQLSRVLDRLAQLPNVFDCRRLE